jgi:HK97 family phage prohead protease
MTQYFRSFTGPVTRSDQHTLEGRIVPWASPTRIVELDENGQPDRYRESFERGAFDAQLKTDNIGIIRKITLRDEHTEGLGKIGWALTLSDRDDGLWGTFRVRDAAVPDVAQMYEDGIDGLSVGFHPLRAGTRIEARGTTDEHRVRTRAYMDHVALVATPSYSDARVLSLRDADDELAEADAELERQQYLGELDGWLVQARSGSARWGK